MISYSQLFAPSSAAESKARKIVVRLANRPLRRLPQGRPLVDYSLNDFSLRIPVSHPLPRILATDPNYLKPLTMLAEAVSAAGSTGAVIDVGANVGDTAVLMGQAGLTKVLCVEGNPTFLPVLRANADRASRRGWTLDVVPHFVGINDAESPVRLETKGGTATLVAGRPRASTNISFISPKDLIEPYETVSLLKIDTDGMDLELLSRFLEVAPGPRFESAFFEFTPQVEPINDAFERLTEEGLDRLYWHDHAGNLICSTSSSDVRSIRQLSRYGCATGTYFDISAVRSASSIAAALDTAYDAD